ncbi:MAG: ribonucleoside triphosphate reductase [Christensenellaceae bacterium]|jgi:ribonucleoside-triphosphate reductase|nr:ribonucleoside triphosphate reductase [Christensenellaceae bacterium]
MIKKVLKRDGSTEDYSRAKIADAIFKAAVACGGTERSRSEKVATAVEKELFEKFKDKRPNIEDIQDLVEKHLIKAGHDQVAKAYILYREKRTSAREENALAGATINMFHTYLDGDDSAVRSTANGNMSVMGLNNYVREEFTKKYWLNEVYAREIADAHRTGEIYIHDLGFFGSYCVGWDVKMILLHGFTGVPNKVCSSPPKNFRSALGQIVNATFTLQGESAGAQAWSSFDTYLAPFIAYDKLTYKDVKDSLQSFVFNMNISTRVGFQCPFSNITLDVRCPKTLEEECVIVGGQPMDKTYGEFQSEMDMFNRAFCEVMSNGDASGRVFSFPIPAINITRDTDWNSDVMNAVMDMSCKYGIPNFVNYVNSDLSPEDAVSMCCRLRLDTRELRKRGGGLFGSNPMTGSIGVVTINLPRLGYKCDNDKEFFDNLGRLADISKTSLEIKRKFVEQQTEKGLYPYSRFYLQGIKETSGGYWANHFSTIGIVGMHECCLNYLDKGIDSAEGREFALRVMHFLREKMQGYQAETGNIYNLEATPAENVAPKLARVDKKRYPDIVTSGSGDAVYYTNSTQLPVQFTDDIFKVIKHQEGLQTLYTGGTSMHIFLGERLDDRETAKNLIKKIFNNSRIPFVSITPTFSICSHHGYIAGEKWKCPTCKKDTEVWSRVVGFLRPIGDWNAGKRQEYKERIKYKCPTEGKPAKKGA